MSLHRSLNFNDLIRDLGDMVVRHDSEAPGSAITGLAYDSRRVEPGFLFAAVSGFKVDGRRFIPQARQAGAVAVLTDQWAAEAGIAQIQVSSVRQAMAMIAAAFYDNPSRKLSLVGVTGTNGKTTTTHLTDAILRQAGLRTGLLGGIEYRIGERSLPANRTTPEAIDLEAMLSEMVSREVNAVTMEVSSHGIELFRIANLEFDVAVFTNLTHDHLDLHGDMEHYYQVKRSLFAGSLGEPGNPLVALSSNRPMAAINIDDAFGERLAFELSDRLVTFGMRPEAQVRAGKIEYAGWETGFELITPAGTAAVRLHLPGAYNLENALAAATAAVALGLPAETIAAGLTASHGAPGRFELVEVKAPFRVVVDYAHNEDGLRKVLTVARALTPGRLITVFGCPGERDREKRPEMGLVAGSLSDLAILTTDDCYGEPPELILDETEPGLVKSGVIYQRVSDRREAIAAAVTSAAAGDTVIITGKGHEKRQMMASGAIPFSDKDVVMEIVGGV